MSGTGKAVLILVGSESDRARIELMLNRNIAELLSECATYFL